MMGHKNDQVRCGGVVCKYSPGDKRRVVGEGVISAFHFSEVTANDLFSLFHLQIVFVESKNANASIHICLANNLFAHADAKKDAKILPLFAK
jgi:hypothetical protein